MEKINHSNLLLGRLRHQRMLNTLALPLLKPLLNYLMTQSKFTPQAKGVVLNPYTSWAERFSLWQRFKELNK